MGLPKTYTNCCTFYADGRTTHKKEIEVETGDTQVYGLYVTSYQLTAEENNSLISTVILKTESNHIPYIFMDYTAGILYVWTDAPNIVVNIRLIFMK